MPNYFLQLPETTTPQALRAIRRSLLEHGANGVALRQPQHAGGSWLVDFEATDSQHFERIREGLSTRPSEQRHDTRPHRSSSQHIGARPYQEDRVSDVISAPPSQNPETVVERVFDGLNRVTNMQGVGSTASYGIIGADNYLTVGHVGDSPVLLYTVDENGNVSSQSLNDAHNPANSREAERVQREGGIIQGDRVAHGNGGIAVTRALGDREIKGLSTEPEVQRWKLRPLKPGESQFVVIGSDGLTERMSPSEYDGVVKEWIKDGRQGDLADAFVRHARVNHTSDNVSASIVEIQGGVARTEDTHFAVFDGHGGDQASQAAHEEFSRVVPQAVEHVNSPPRPQPKVEEPVSGRPTLRERLGAARQAAGGVTHGVADAVAGATGRAADALGGAVYSAADGIGRAGRSAAGLARGAVSFGRGSAEPPSGPAMHERVVSNHFSGQMGREVYAHRDTLDIDGVRRVGYRIGRPGEVTSRGEVKGAPYDSLHRHGNDVFVPDHALPPQVLESAKQAFHYERNGLPPDGDTPRGAAGNSGSGTSQTRETPYAPEQNGRNGARPSSTAEPHATGRGGGWRGGAVGVAVGAAVAAGAVLWAGGSAAEAAERAGRSVPGVDAAEKAMKGDVSGAAKSVVVTGLDMATNGAATPVVEGAGEAYDKAKAGDTAGAVKAGARAGARAAGVAGGAYVGMMAGAALGSALPGVGTVVGGAIGSAVGAMGGDKFVDAVEGTKEAINQAKKRAETEDKAHREGADPSTGFPGLHRDQVRNDGTPLDQQVAEAKKKWQDEHPEEVAKAKSQSQPQSQAKNTAPTDQNVANSQPPAGQGWGDKWAQNQRNGGQAQTSASPPANGAARSQGSTTTTPPTSSASTPPPQAPSAQAQSSPPTPPSASEGQAQTAVPPTAAVPRARNDSRNVASLRNDTATVAPPAAPQAPQAPQATSQPPAPSQAPPPQAQQPQAAQQPPPTANANPPPPRRVAGGQAPSMG